MSKFCDRFWLLTNKKEIWENSPCDFISISSFDKPFSATSLRAKVASSNHTCACELGCKTVTDRGRQQWHWTNHEAFGCSPKHPFSSFSSGIYLDRVYKRKPTAWNLLMQIYTLWQKTVVATGCLPHDPLFKRWDGNIA